MPTTTGLATSFITFSRPGASGGGATVTDRDGRIKWAGHNLLTNSESFDASAWSKAGGVTVAANTIAAPNGTTTADEIAFTTTGSVMFRLTGNFPTVILGATYTHGVWLRAKTGTFKLKISRTDTTTWTTATVSNEITLTTDWQLVTITYTVGAGDAGLSDFIIGAESKTPYSLPATGSIYAWGAYVFRNDLGGMQLNPAMPAGMQSYYPTTPRNALGWTEDFSNAAWVVAVGTATKTSNTDIAPNGLQTADTLTATSANATIWQTYVPVVDCKYVGSIWLRRKTGSGTVQITVDASTYTTVAITDVWQRFSVSYTGVIGTKAFGVRIVTSGDEVYAWGAQLSDSASLDTYVPQYGAAVTSAAYYAPRLDFDGATLAAKGLLVEEARTNIVLHSNDFSQAAWTKINGGAGTAPTVTSGQSDPWGGATAWRLQADAGAMGAGNYSLVRQTISSVTSPRTIWIKSNTGSNQSVAFGPAEIGMVITATPTWTRVSISPTSTNPIFDIGSYPVGTGNTTQSVDVLIWGAQCETASGSSVTFNTSYIPTGASTATRAADVASVSTSAFPYSASEGTLVVAFNTSSLQASVLGDPSAQFIAYLNAGKWRSYNGTSIVETSNALLINTVAKGAFGYDATGRAVCLNSGAVATNSGLHTMVSPLQIGYAAFSGSYLNGHIRQITYLPRRISNAELQSRTA